MLLELRLKELNTLIGVHFVSRTYVLPAPGDCSRSARQKDQTLVQLTEGIFGKLIGVPFMELRG